MCTFVGITLAQAQHSCAGLYHNRIATGDSDGRFSVSAGPYLLILFHFIGGEPVGFGSLPDEDVDTLGFYYYRRGLQDLADWIQRILYADQDDAKDRRTLCWTGETMAELSKVETTLGKISARFLHR